MPGIEIPSSKIQRRMKETDQKQTPSHVKKSKPTQRHRLPMLCCRFFAMSYLPQKEVAERILDLVKFHESGIKTWSGRVLVEQKFFKSQDMKEIQREEDYEILFIYDYVTENYKISFLPTKSIAYEDGKKIFNVLKKETLLYKDNVYHDYQTFSNMPEAITDDQLKMANMFSISSNFPKLFIKFEPLRDSS